MLGISGFLHSLSLDLLGCMQTILSFSKYIKMETYDYKNHIKIKIQRRKKLIPGFEYSQINSTWRRKSMKFSYTQDFPSNDSNHNPTTPKFGQWNGGNCDFFSLRRWKTVVSKKVMKTLTPKRAFIGFPYEA